MTQMQYSTSARPSRTALAGLVLAVTAVSLMLAGYAGTSMALVPVETGFHLFLGGVALSFIALAVSLMGWRLTRQASGRNRAWAGILISLGILALMSPFILAAFSVPPIHDITTDTDNPPVFTDILPLRAGAPNSAEYAGETLAGIQKAAYPGIAPLILDVPPAEAFARAQKIIVARGWTLAAANAQEGRLEAVSESKNMHFRDDVVIRITASGEGSRVDMRSLSRFGQSDLGVNAQRIMDFLQDMRAP